MSKRFKRNVPKRKQYSFIYVFTEGTKTEPIYFESKKSEIRRNYIKIEIKGSGYNTVSLVDYVLDFIKENKIDLTIDECWVVFDKDDFVKDFDNAINKAETNNLKVAYSNEAFELWFLLHFSFMSSAIRRKDYNKKVTENLRRLTGDKKYKYSKTTGIYSLIKDRESDAIKNAKKLLKQHAEEKSFLKKNPSTTVHLLVEKLNKLKK